MKGNGYNDARLLVMYSRMMAVICSACAGMRQEMLGRYEYKRATVAGVGMGALQMSQQAYMHKQFVPR